MTWIFVLCYCVVQGAADTECSASEIQPCRNDAEVLSWAPRIFSYDQFLSAEECDYLVAKARQGTSGRIAVYTAAGDVNFLPNTVSSEAVFVNDSDPVIAGIRSRIALVAMQPESAMEPSVLIRYRPGQYFRGHLDGHLKPGRESSSRVATMFMYLYDVEEGGQTYFPLGTPATGSPHEEPASCHGFGGKDPTMQTEDELAAYFDGAEEYRGEGPTGVVVTPKKGRALLWYNKLSNGTTDILSRHAGCPLVKGEKFTLTVWIHNIPHAEAKVIGQANKNANDEKISPYKKKSFGCREGTPPFWIEQTGAMYLVRQVETSRRGPCKWREFHTYNKETHDWVEWGGNESGRYIVLFDASRSVYVRLSPFKIMMSTSPTDFNDTIGYGVWSETAPDAKKK